MLSKTANASRAGTALGTQRRAHRISREQAGATAAIWKAQRISCERGERWHPGQSRDCPARRCFQRPERVRAFRLGRLMPDHADRWSGWSLKTVAAKGILVGPLRTHHTLPGVERQASDVSPPPPGGKLRAPVSPSSLQGCLSPGLAVASHGLFTRHHSLRSISLPHDSAVIPWARCAAAQKKKSLAKPLT